MESNKIVDQKNQILLTVGSKNSTSVSVNKHTGITSTSTILQDLFLQYVPFEVNHMSTANSRTTIPVQYARNIK